MQMLQEKINKEDWKKKQKKQESLEIKHYTS